MEQKKVIRLRGNLSDGDIMVKITQIPHWLYAFRGICFLFDNFAEATTALDHNHIPPASAIVVKRVRKNEAFLEKQSFSEAFLRSDRFNDSFLLTADEETAADVEGLCFYLENPNPKDLFYQIETGDVLDYQIPAGNFNLDLPNPGRKDRLCGGGQDDYSISDLCKGIRVIQDRYTRFFLLAGEKSGLMIDCGFGKGDLKKFSRIILRENGWLP